MNYIVARCTSPSSDCDLNSTDASNYIDHENRRSQTRLRPSFCSRQQLVQELKFTRLRWDLNDINYFLYSQLCSVWTLWLVRLGLTTAYAFTLIYVCVTSASVAIEAEYDEVPNPFEDWAADGESSPADGAGNASLASSGATEAETQQKHQPFIVYLTYWNFLVTCIYLIGSSAIMLIVKLTDGDAYRLNDGPYLVAWDHKMKRRPISSLPVWFAAHCIWLAMHTSYTGSLLVTCIGLWHSLIRPTYARLFMHGCNSFLMLADAFTTGLPFRLAYLIYVELAGWLYLAFSAVYWSFDPFGNVLYPGLLDWNSPSWSVAVACIVSLVCTPTLHCLSWLFAGRWRDWLARRRRSTRQLNDPSRRQCLIAAPAAGETAAAKITANAEDVC
ncbi:hypothetical protein BOX15_Mlig015662g2 [Macrostomum lignano]|uniref:Uncharacterized protein n=1 Tax=Macrostomum lignano TaxID=282301 RepID=A0A267GZZ0_9PLAT|nr:hypothetical protein BOX15_Mlig015662g2 [Macrostomum lignano]